MRKTALLPALLLAGGLFLTPAMAPAYWMSSDTGMSLSIGAGNYLLSQAVLDSSSPAKTQESRRQRTTPPPAANTSNTASINTRFTPTRRGRGLDEMAARYPAAERAEARRKMQQLYDHWPQMAQQLGVPANDMGSALAAYLVGSWMAYRDVDYPDAQFKLATEQMRHVLAEFPDFAGMSNADRQYSHEQLVTLGILVALTRHELKQSPNRQVQAQLRQLAGRNLRQFLNVDPDRVHFRADGLMEIR
ncbi:hypothetical protein CO611_01755 [Lysobacteraceae bacterium NML03-0222]|nr:hypothetical protein CO611_01755 [Xanthomonadaceae bacterium NML03-0222]